MKPYRKTIKKIIRIGHAKNMRLYFRFYSGFIPQIIYGLFHGIFPDSFPVLFRRFFHGTLQDI